MRELQKKDYRTLGLSALGGALEFYDFVVFVFFIKVLSGLFFPPSMPEWLQILQGYAIFAAGYLARPLGGIVIAHYGDKLGRKKMFTLSLLLMALPTLGMGLLPTYADIGLAAPILLLFLRVLQGAAIGGEVPGAWVFVSEHVPAHRTGLAVGTLTAGLTGGILLGSLVAAAINRNFEPSAVQEFAWRIPFLLGGVFGLFSVYLRRYLEETPVFQAMAQEKQLSAQLPMMRILKEYPSSVALSMLLTWVLSALIVVMILYVPTYLQQVHAIHQAQALSANSIATLMLTIGCVFFGWLTDRVGARLSLGLGCSGVVMFSFWFFIQPFQGGQDWVFWYGVVAFFVGVVGAIPYFLVRAFPAALRFSGLSFSYNVAYAIFGGFTPVWIAAWQRQDSLAPAYYVVLLGLLGVVMAYWVKPRYQVAKE